MKGSDFLNRVGLNKKLLCALAVVAMIVLASMPVNFVIADAQGTAAANGTNSLLRDSSSSSISERDFTQSDFPAACTQSSSTAVPVDQKLDCKPKLYQFLGENNKMQGNNVADELRMDFVIRLPHGMVNPSCVALGSTSDYTGNMGQSNGRDCGMQVIFSRTNSDGKTTPGSWTRDLRAAKYLNTYGGDGSNVNQGNGRSAATAWAHNVDEYYTIHNVMVSGNYDFITMSLEGDIAYSVGNTIANSNVGGVKFLPQYVYILASTGRGSRNASDYQFGDFGAISYITNIAADRPAYMYANGTDSPSVSSVADANAKLPYANNGPISYIGWDNNTNLWSGGQANWGLVTDYGFSGQPSGSTMVAPANSFFVEWYNKAQGKTYSYKDSSGKSQTMPYPCSQNTSFYYQWFGLDGHTWEPVTTLTPSPVKFTGAPALSGYDGSKSAFNATNRGYGWGNNTPNGKLIVPGAGTANIAQNADGSIDFGKAKAAQPELDGYFKLVTWPITTTPTTSDPNGPQSYDGCIATDAPTGNSSFSIRDAYNPLYNDADPSNPIDININTPQAQITDAMAKGWTIDSAYAKYAIDRPAPPVINGPASTYSDPDNRTITGTGIPGYKVTLYREDPSAPIDSNDPDNTSTRGIRIGTATVQADKTWSITDNTRINPLFQGHVRYHAWQTENTSGYDISSLFSNITQENFELTLNQNPQISTLSVPHTVRVQSGVNYTADLPSGSKVTITGQYDAARGDATLQVYVVPQDGVQVSSVGSQAITLPDAKWKVCDNGAVDPAHPSTRVRGTWTCQVNPSTFADANHTKSNGTLYIWYKIFGVLTDTSGQQPTPQNISEVDNQVIDMYAPVVTVNSVDRDTGVSGSVTKARTGETMSGLDVQVTWPDGTTKTVTTDSSGHWQTDVPITMQGGTVSAVTTDTANERELTRNIGAVAAASNQSLPATGTLRGYPASGALPFTGRRPWGSFALVLLTAALAIFGYLASRRLRSGLTHKGAHAK